MTTKLKPELRKYLNATPNDINRGYLSRSLEAGYFAIWAWSAPRFSGSVGMKHEAFWDKFGRDAYYRRINKVRAGCGFEPLKGV